MFKKSDIIKIGDNMKKFKHIGVYGLIINNDEIVLIKKNGGPYNGKLDLPGGTIVFGEKPENTLVRELNEEVGIEVIEYELFDSNSIVFEWEHKGELESGHHIGIFYKVIKYNGKIKTEIEIDKINDDSNGADFYKIDDLQRNMLSDIAIIEIEKLGYKLK